MLPLPLSLPPFIFSLPSSTVLDGGFLHRIGYLLSTPIQPYFYFKVSKVLLSFPGRYWTCDPPASASWTVDDRPVLPGQTSIILSENYLATPCLPPNKWRLLEKVTCFSPWGLCVIWLGYILLLSFKMPLWNCPSFLTYLSDCSLKKYIGIERK